MNSGKHDSHNTLNELNIGDRVVVKPGEKIPADGLVIEGETSVNEAMLTGESKPVPKSPGGKVAGGSINGEGSIIVEIRKTGTDVAVDTADIILVRSNPLDMVAVLGLARATYRKMVQNLVWATGTTPSPFHLRQGYFTSRAYFSPLRWVPCSCL